MRKIAIGAVVISGLFCSTAIAADIIPSKDTIDAIGVSTESIDPYFYDWSGFYVGVNAGYRASDIKSFKDAESHLNNISLDKISGGIFGGYNYHFYNNVVIGIEADFSSDNAHDTIKNIIDKKGFPSVAEIKSKSNVSIRGRVGYAFDQVMPFVAAGLTYGDFSANGSSIIPVISNLSEVKTSTWEINKNKLGYTLGAGIDMAMMNNVIFRVEYRYNDYGNLDLGFNQKNKTSSQEAKVGVSYKF